VSGSATAWTEVFFVLSKILDVLLTPLAWATALVALGLFGRRRGSLFRRVLGASGLVVLLVFSSRPVANALMRALETPVVRTVKPGVVYDVVILLGGVTDDLVESTWGQRAFNDNNERLLETYDLLRRGTATNAIISGAADPDVPRKMSEAQVLADQLTQWGIESSRIVVEDRARNTHENAVYSAAIVRARGWSSVVMVTSGYHMRRALGCFVAEGLPVDVLPVDFRSYASPFTGELIPRSEYFDQSSRALREWFGRGIYRARGYSR
jgi:uncharacterized SAM-binding protein YcdF (DUF218 family)